MPLTAEIARLTQAILELPHAIAPEVSRASDALFAPLHEPSLAHRIERDLAYGPHARHRLDVHAPTQLKSPAPVLLFVHGGGYVKGDKTEPGIFYYDNVGAWGASEGFVTVNMTYRLAPEHLWPSGAQDVAAAVQWLREHVARYGGDPARIFVMGHSAGAAHVAGYVAGHGSPTDTDHHLAGCILVSGTYDLVAGPANKNYFGDDASQYAQRSMLPGLLACRLPLLLAVAEADPPHTQRQFAGTLAAFTAAGQSLPYIAQVWGHNHYTITHHLNTSDKRFSDRIAEFIARP